MPRHSAPSPRAVGRRYLHDATFRWYVGICAGLTLNLCYAVFRTVTGLLWGSVWLIASAVYFLLLALIRVSLAVSYRRRAGKPADFERRRYLCTARLLFLLNLLMSALILLTLAGNSEVSAYPGYTIYASATYTFWLLTHAVVQTVRFRRVGSPILSASGAVSLVAALMSLFGLQNGMIVTFSAQADGFRQLMNTLTGIGISLATVGIAIAMRVRAATSEREELHE